GAGNGTIVEMGSGKYPQLHLAGDITTTEDIALRVRYYSPAEGGEIGANLLYSDSGWNTIGGMALDRASSSAVGNIMIFGIQVAKGSLSIAGPVRGLCSSGFEASGVFVDPNVLRFRLTTPEARAFANGPIIDGTIGTGGVSVQTSEDNVGTVALLGDNTYTGATVHRKGVLLVNNTTGSGTGTGAVRVASGATLGGHGVIAPAGNHGVIIESGAVLAPGGVMDPAAVLADARPLTFDLRATGGQVVFEADSSIAIDLGREAGVSDRIAVTGLSGAKSRVLFKNTTVNFTHTGPVARGLYTLVTFDDYDAYNAQLSIGTGLEGYDASLQYTGQSIQLLVEGGPGAN
ncbi:MAG: PEP-CTERM sorting domain-containing protein, partial [Verrucomicrobiota bacterium]